MRIALVIFRCDPGRGGAERYTADLAGALVGRGHEVWVLASDASAHVGAMGGAKCIDISSRGMTRVGRYNHFLRSLDARLMAGAAEDRGQGAGDSAQSAGDGAQGAGGGERGAGDGGQGAGDGARSAGGIRGVGDGGNDKGAAHESRRWDVVHAMLPVHRCHLYHPHAGVAMAAVASGHLKHQGALARAASRLANRINRKRRRFAQVEQALLTSPAPPVVLCLSDYVRGEVLRHYRLPDQRLARLFNGVDLKRFDPAAVANRRAAIRAVHQIQPEETAALIVAQDFARKGVAEAIAATAHSGVVGLKLLVVGRDEPAPYVAMAERLGVKDRVIFAGPAADVRDHHAAADFFVLPTRHDPCSLVVLEALAMGLPVISTRQNGATEIMTPGRHGFVLASAADLASLTVAMRELSNPAQRAEMHLACLRLREALSMETHLTTLEHIYRQVAAPAGG